MDDIEYLEEMKEVVLKKFGNDGDLCKLVFSHSTSWMCYYSVGKNDRWNLIDKLTVFHKDFRVAASRLRYSVSIYLNEGK